MPRSEQRSTNGSDHDDVVQSGCCWHCSVLREMKLRTYASLSHLTPVPVCFFVATFDPTVERAQNRGERRTEFVRRSLHQHGQVACASSRFIVSRRAAPASELPRARGVGIPRSVGTKPLFEARDTGATLGSERHFYPSLSQALGSRLHAVFQRETMAFSRGLGGSMKHWILEASNILPETKKALRRCKALIFLVFLAPRPGLEPEGPTD